MFKLLVHCCIILLGPCFANAKQSNDTPSAIDQEILPLVLIKIEGKMRIPREEQDELEIPTRVEIKKDGFASRKRIHFARSYFENQRFYCPAETKEQKDKITKANEVNEAKPNYIGEKYDNNCLFKIKGKSTKSRLPECKKQLEPKIMKNYQQKTNQELISEGHENLLPTLEEVVCGPGIKKTGKSFRFGYQVCVESEGFSEKIDFYMYKRKRKEMAFPFVYTEEIYFYDFCYDATEKGIIYTLHSILSPSLLSDGLLSIERQKTSKMSTTNSPHLTEVDFERIKLELEKVTNSSTGYKIQLLVPPEDFAFLSWKKPAYHYINASLIHIDLQACWDNIHDMARKYSKKVKRSIDIYTGVFKLPSENEEILTVGKVQIPKIWVKIFHLKNKEEDAAVAVIANNYKNDAVNDLIKETYKCRNHLCHNFIEQNFGKVTNYIRCCRVTEEINSLFGVDISSLALLKIDNLIEAVGVGLQRYATSPARSSSK